MVAGAGAGGSGASAEAGNFFDRTEPARFQVAQHGGAQGDLLHQALGVVEVPRNLGGELPDGRIHDGRAPDYDDWITPRPDGGRGLNGDILVWNPVTKRRHELTSMGIRVNAETLRQQLEITGQLDFLKFPYHKAIVNNEVPLSIGGGIGQSRTLMLLLRKAHLGEVSVTVWPQVLKDMCARKDIHVLE